MNNKQCFSKHRGPVTSVTQLDENCVVTSGYDGAVAKFDLKSNTVKLIGYHDHLVNKVIANKEGTKVASCSSDYSIKVWNTNTLELERTLLGHSDDVEDFIFINNELGVSASRDQRVLVWNLETGAIQTIIEGHKKDVLSLAYDNGKLISTGDDKTLRIWNIETGELLHTWGPFQVETDTCAIDVINQRVILGCDDGFIRIFDIEAGDLIKEIKAHESGIKKVAVSPKTGDILSAAYDQKIIIWDSHSFYNKTSLQNIPTKWERSLLWSKQGDYIFAGTFDGTILIWEARKGVFIRELGDNQENVGNICFNEVAVSNNNLALVSDDGFVRTGNIYHLSDQTLEVFEPSSGRFLMNAVALNNDNTFITCGSHNQKIHIFQNGDIIKHNEYLIGEGPINTIRFATEKEMFIGCYSGVIVKMNTEGDIISNLDRIHNGAVKSLRIHPHESFGISCSAEGEFRSWDFDGQIFNEYLGHTSIINDVDFSPSGEYVASVSRDFTLKVFRFQSGELLATYSLGKRSLKSVCFVSDELVVVGDYWGYLYSIFLGTGKVISRKIASNGISSVVRYNGSVVATSYDGTIHRINPTGLTTIDLKAEMLQRIDLVSN